MKDNLVQVLKSDIIYNIIPNLSNQELKIFLKTDEEEFIFSKAIENNKKYLFLTTLQELSLGDLSAKLSNNYEEDITKRKLLIFGILIKVNSIDMSEGQTYADITPICRAYIKEHNFFASGEFSLCRDPYEEFNIITNKNESKFAIAELQKKLCEKIDFIISDTSTLENSKIKANWEELKNFFVLKNNKSNYFSVENLIMTFLSFLNINEKLLSKILRAPTSGELVNECFEILEAPYSYKFLNENKLKNCNKKQILANKPLSTNLLAKYQNEEKDKTELEFLTTAYNIAKDESKNDCVDSREEEVEEMLSHMLAENEYFDNYTGRITGDSNAPSNSLTNKTNNENSELYDDAISGKERFFENFYETNKHKLSENAKNEFKDQFNRYVHGGHGDRGAALCYLNTFTSLPFGKEAPRQTDFTKAKDIIEKSHYGMRDVKDRILEFIAVNMNKDKCEGERICLTGPPGVGKTSIASSIAEALGRPLVRFSAGALNDPMSLIGCESTFMASKPGAIIRGLCNTKVDNPVFLIDEIDKISGITTKNGNPMDALLEILDPEQNKSFRDLYLSFPYDISKVLFILTGNKAREILPDYMLDRIEVIDVPGYLISEKVNIAKNYLIPKIINKNCNKQKINISDKILYKIVSSYCREPGVRQLKNSIDKISRKLVIEQMSSKNISPKVEIQEKDLKKYLGNEKFSAEDISITKPGVAIGLAYTSLGGCTLKMESIAVSGKGNVKITGSLGEVMKESVSIALTLVKSLTNNIPNSNNYFKENDFHLHFPDGSTPKDGPSAGITIATSLMSLFLKTKIKEKLAMTGEITLSGDVLPIGGLREKLQAASENGIKHIIIPKKNENDLEEVPKEILDRLDIKNVSRIEEVFDIAFDGKWQKNLLNKMRAENSIKNKNINKNNKKDKDMDEELSMQ